MKHLRFLIASISVISLVSCIPKQAQVSSSIKPKKILLGLSLDSFLEERWTRDRDIFTATANRLGAEVIVQDGEADAEVQAEQIRYMLDKGVQSIVVIPNNADGLTKISQEAKRRNVKILCYERIIKNADTDLYLSFDAEKVGRLQADAMVNRIKRGEIAILNGFHSDPVAQETHSGILAAISEHDKNDNIRVVEDTWMITDGSEEAYRFALHVIDAHPSIKAIITPSDMAAEAVINALAVRRLAGRILVSGVGADLSACQRIAEGTQFITVYKPIDLIASTAAELSVYLAKNERVTVHNAILDGTFRIPHYKLLPIIVSKETLKSTVIKDGFHSQTDIFRNVLAE